jgi:hypothetical protein
MAAGARSLDAYTIRTCMLMIEDNCPLQDGGEFVNVACNRLLGELIQIPEQLNGSTTKELPDANV